MYGSDPFAYRLRLDSPRPVAEVTVDALKRHVKRYGPDGVEKTARDAGLGEAELLELGFGGSTKDRVQALAAQGLVVAEIAKRLNLSFPTVRRHLAG